MQLLYRGGFVRSHGSGMFSFLPLGLRVLRNLKRIVAEEMDALGGQEVSMPLVAPLDLFQRSRRAGLINRDMAGFLDRSGRKLVLSPTHEEAAVELVRPSLHSYRDLPIFVYQFQDKFRDEARAHHGLMRAREFLMKDAYSFHRSFAELNNFFPRVFASYERVFRRCRVPVVAAEAGVGYMGGDRSYEFLTYVDYGDDTVVECPHCQYRANSEVAVAISDVHAESPLPPSTVQTGAGGRVDELATSLEVGPSRIGKAMLFMAETGPVIVVVRGDREVSTEKLARILGEPVLRLAKREEVGGLGLDPRYLSPLGDLIPQLRAEHGLRVVVDQAVSESSNLVLGTNSPGERMVNANFGRDYGADLVGDVARVVPGQRCMFCGTSLDHRRAIELGNIFRLGTHYSRRMGLRFQSEAGPPATPHMGSYGIGLGRLMLAIVEANHDNSGIRWPMEIAPYPVFLMAIGRSPKVRDLCEDLYRSLPGEVLLDDRTESISSKLKDADLLGIPVRIIVGAESVADGHVEVMRRNTGSVDRVPMYALPQVLADLQEEESRAV